MGWPIRQPALLPITNPTRSQASDRRCRRGRTRLGIPPFSFFHARQWFRPASVNDGKKVGRAADREIRHSNANENPRSLLCFSVLRQFFSLSARSEVAVPSIAQAPPSP